MSFLLLLILALGTQLNPRMNEFMEQAAPRYVFPTQNLELIYDVPNLVPEGTTVVTSPWNGSSFLYALTGVHSTTTHFFYTPTPQEWVIQNNLNQVARYPDQICPVLAEAKVEYVLDFGDGYSNIYQEMPGMIDLNTADGFTVVKRRGHAVLYRIDACD
jgi:hypothetical protein